MLALIVMLAVCGAEPAKELSPKQKREAAEKVIKDKMAPIEKELVKQHARLAFIKACPVTPGKSGRAKVIDGEGVATTYRTAELKSAAMVAPTKAIADLTAKLKPLQDELKALKKPPKPEPPKAPEKPPEKKP